MQILIRIIIEEDISLVGSETHFKVVIVSDSFNDKPLLQRHRLVNDALKDELATGVHALSIQVFPSRIQDLQRNCVSCQQDLQILYHNIPEDPYIYLYVSIIF